MGKWASGQSDLARVGHIDLWHEVALSSKVRMLRLMISGKNRDADEFPGLTDHPTEAHPCRVSIPSNNGSINDTVR